MWGRGVGPAARRDTDGALVNLMNTRRTATTRPTRPRRRVHPRALLRPRPAHQASWSSTWTDDEIWALQRGGHDYRKIYAAYKAATEHTGQPTVILAKTIKGYARAALRGRNATHQMKKLTLDDLQGLPRPARHPDHDEQLETRTCRPTTTRGRTTSRSSTCSSGGARSAASCPSGAPRPKPLVLPGDAGLRRRQARVGQAGGRHDDGVRPAAQGPHQGQGDRPPDRADHPRRGPHLRHGLVVPDAKIYNPHGQNYTVRGPRADAVLQGVRGRADPARGDQRGRLGRVVHRRRHGVRHARRADDPVLHLLLDVRLPAHRRRLLGRGRPDGPRVRARRHRRAHHAQRRGPAARRRSLAAARRDQPGGGLVRPGVRLRARPHRQGRPARMYGEDGARTSSTT
jgi:hypothetical protein